MILQLKRPLVFLDFETTGLDVKNDRILELAFIRLLPDGTREEFVQRINPGIDIRMVPMRVGDAELDGLVAQADVVLDCCDNFATRHAVNRTCLRHRKPLVSGAALRFDGQVTVFDLRNPDAPCYACLFPPSEPAPEAACATMGVFAPLVGMIGTVQAAEALKLLTGVGETLAGRLLMVNAMSMEWTTMRLLRTPGCEVCGGDH